MAEEDEEEWGEAVAVEVEVEVEVEVLGAEEEAMGAQSTGRGGGWGFGAAAQEQEATDDEWSYERGAWRREAAPVSEADWGPGVDVEAGPGAGAGAGAEVEVEVEAVASRDESEEAREQLLSLVDAALFSGELVLSTVVGRTKSTVLPKLVSDEVLDDVLPQTWSILKSFDEEARETQQRADQIEGEVLDTLAKLVKRK